MPKIYLSGPIDNCSPEQAVGWRNQLKEDYKQYEFLDPIDVENYLSNPTAAIEQEKFHILESDVFLCYPWKPSTGTPMEAMFAYVNDKIVVTVSEGTYLSEWIKYHSNYVALSFPNAMNWINARYKI